MRGLRAANYPKGTVLRVPSGVMYRVYEIYRWEGPTRHGFHRMTTLTGKLRAGERLPQEAN
jgi:hypothetical protein